MYQHVKDHITPHNPFYIFSIIFIKGIFINKYFFAIHAIFNISKQTIHNK